MKQWLSDLNLLIQEDVNKLESLLNALDLKCLKDLARDFQNDELKIN